MLQSLISQQRPYIFLFTFPAQSRLPAAVSRRDDRQNFSCDQSTLDLNSFLLIQLHLPPGFHGAL